MVLRLNHLNFLTTQKLNIVKANLNLLDSGYRKIDFSNFELIIDIGKIGPDYQPGHGTVILLILSYRLKEILYR